MEKIEPDQLVAILDEDGSLFAIGITVKKIASGKSMWDVRMSYAKPGQRPSIIKESRLKVLKPLSKEEVQSLSPAESFKKHRQEIIDSIIEQAKEKEDELTRIGTELRGLISIAAAKY